jgi:hypothetical protein
MLKLKHCLIPVLLAVLFSNAQKGAGSLLIRLHPVFDGRELILSENAYVDQNGDSVYIDVFKFYFSHVCLAGGPLFCEPESYHLINAEAVSTLSFTLKNIPTGIYTDLLFEIGVDSLKNTQGVLTGDLDPIKGMYWTWNTGYISAKIEGRSKTCKTLHNAFEFHIGGYLQPYPSLRKQKISIDNLTISAGNTAHLDLYADVAEWFKTPLQIDISKVNSIVLPNKQSVMIADNYSDMIKLKSETRK